MIDLLQWCKKNQNKGEDRQRDAHIREIIKHFNLVARQLALGREFNSVRDTVPKVGN